MEKWMDLARHSPGCPYKGVAVYGNEAELAKYHSGFVPDAMSPSKWEKAKKETGRPASGPVKTIALA